MYSVHTFIYEYMFYKFCNIMSLTLIIALAGKPLEGNDTINAGTSTVTSLSLIIVLILKTRISLIFVIIY